ncbi:MAG: hypothetical protein V1909_00925 [Candidatus Micrarchaeota archaeon]
MKIILILLLAFVFLFILASVAVLIFFGIKKSKEKKSPFSVLVASSSGSPLEGVDVKLGEDVAVTDSYGKALFNSGPGEKELLIIAQGHSDFRQKVRLSESSMFHAKLVKDKPLPEAKELEEAIASARRGREEIGAGYNQTIPDYLFNICLAVHKMGIDWAKSESDQAIRSDSLKSAAFTISQTEKGMIERRNLSLYAKAKGKKIRAVELPPPRSPDIFAAKQKLGQVDLLITHSAGKSAIYPPLILWKTAQKLLNSPTVFNLRLSTFLLDSAEKMIGELDDYLA